MKRFSWPAIGAAAFLLIACNTNGPVTSTPKVSVEARTDTASMQRGLASYDSMVASGLHYHFAGRLSNLNVSSTGGRTSVSAHAADGDYVDVTLEHIPSTLFSFGNRTKSFLPEECGDCGSGGKSSAPPHGQATNPPNYGGCASAGGATWFNESTGDGGCLGMGSSRGFPCGNGPGRRQATGTSAVGTARSTPTVGRFFR
jgi:hypothetical protein